MKKESNTSNVFQAIVQKACEGTSITTKELIKTLDWEDIARIKEGELTVEDLRLTVLELADSKDMAAVYTTAPSSNGSFSAGQF